MELKAVKHIGKMGVIVGDSESDVAEVVKIDTLRLRKFYIDYAAKVMLFSFAWGGYDSSGVFRFADGVNASERTINAQVDGEREIWDACCVCPKGNPLPMSEYANIAKKVLFEHKKLQDVVNGGWNIPEVELRHEGECVFAKAPKGQK